MAATAVAHMEGFMTRSVPGQVPGVAARRSVRPTGVQGVKPCSARFARQFVSCQATVEETPYRQSIMDDLVKDRQARMKKEDEGRQAEKASKATPESKGGFGGGFGGGKTKSSAGKKSAKPKSNAAKRNDDSELIGQVAKEYEKLVGMQNKTGCGILEFVVSVRAAGGEKGAGFLADWLPIAELMILLEDEEPGSEPILGSVVGMYPVSVDSVVKCAISERKSAIAAMARRAAKSGTKHLEFAYEPVNCFEKAQAALKGMDQKALADALATLDLQSGASPADIRKAYRTMAAQFHPDKHTALPAEEHAAMAQKFQKIQNAAETLKGKRVQKGQLYKDLGGSERNAFVECVSLDKAACAIVDQTIGRDFAAIFPMASETNMQFAVRNTEVSKKQKSTDSEE
mmetsp:Transcript_46136/g.76876  ORF Transcript_46136/g.76876 Transcript_46136/m.76876 type:complete len:400 (+) Transcript_46136:133-1332(+)|eukprot:CAMPEP_0198213724 /NCGR_PEP_ID=MMETSP1445-20131203/31475_1 /TAXON_ID=36898 /ORGANISM="Pyramimonas sp., Strain CCMP2087" /LENGTH=399 /DNA_ID=CAMNT_0043888455 /DNA_START=130 /DNA_END=1329 /DNA_ORIENTATION=+